MTALLDTLGSGDALKTRINSALAEQGLPESTGMTAPTKAVVKGLSNGATLSPPFLSPLWALTVLAAAGAAAI
jgi:hypothetical protein